MNFNKIINNILREGLSREERIRILKDLNDYHVTLAVIMQYTRRDRGWGDSRAKNIPDIINNDTFSDVSIMNIYEKYKTSFINDLHRYLEDRWEDQSIGFENVGSKFYNDALDTFVYELPFYTKHEADIADELGEEDIETQSLFYVIISEEFLEIDKDRIWLLFNKFHKEKFKINI